MRKGGDEMQPLMSAGGEVTKYRGGDVPGGGMENISESNPKRWFRLLKKISLVGPREKRFREGRAVDGGKGRGGKKRGFRKVRFIEANKKNGSEERR